jgi:phenylpropionate dioxygenase-like ring-hydroxylating dioxygenase large terminal subunit
VDDDRFSVAFPRRAWYPAAPSGDVGRRPVAITLMEQPLVLFRDGRGRVGALPDRCPHRNLPLSMGRVTGGVLECGYHGWCFDAEGRCTSVPGLLEGAAASSPARDVGSLPVVEQDGFVWVWADPGSPADGRPFALPAITGRGAGEVVFRYDLDCTLHAALENALDVPHTVFLHRGVFRGGSPREITAVRRDLPGGLEVQYLGEPVGLGRVRAGDGAREFDHWDRFFLPSIAQIEYRVEGWLRIVNTILHLPMAPFRTRAWFVVRFWTRLPAPAVRPIVLARGRQILRQDAKVLARQTAHVRQHGGERYTSTELDLMGNAIWRLLRQAERGESPDRADGGERSVTFRI